MTRAETGNYCLFFVGLRGHVNKKKFQKSKKTLEGGGWVKCPIGYKKKLENIFLCIISFGFGKHSNVYNKCATMH